MRTVEVKVTLPGVWVAGAIRAEGDIVSGLDIETALHLDRMGTAKILSIGPAEVGTTSTSPQTDAPPPDAGLEAEGGA